VEFWLESAVSGRRPSGCGRRKRPDKHYEGFSAAPKIDRFVK